jgi:glycerophosphoryl diester phosphodiesterase
MHDDTLDRTTDCEGELDEWSWDDLAQCRIDRIGIGEARQNLEPGDPRLEPVPDLSSIIALLKETGATANIEVKNFGTGDFAFASEVYSELAASGLPSRQVIVQNFIQGNLEQAPVLYPGVATSYLTFGFLPVDLVIDTAVDSGYDWVSPQWPVTSQFVAGVRSAGLGVVPWTVDDPVDLIEAGRLGVDAVITNDPALAERLIGPRPALSLRATRPVVRTRPAQTVSLRVRVRNGGDAASGALAVSAAYPARSLRLIGSATRAIAPVPAGGIREVRFRFRLRPQVRPGSRHVVRFRLPNGRPGGLTAVSRVRVTAR